MFATMFTDGITDRPPTRAFLSSQSVSHAVALNVAASSCSIRKLSTRTGSTDKLAAGRRMSSGVPGSVTSRCHARRHVAQPDTLERRSRQWP